MVETCGVNLKRGGHAHMFCCTAQVLSEYNAFSASRFLRPSSFWNQRASSRNIRSLCLATRCVEWSMTESKNFYLKPYLEHLLSRRHGWACNSFLAERLGLDSYYFEGKLSHSRLRHQRFSPNISKTFAFSKILFSKSVLGTNYSIASGWRSLVWADRIPDLLKTHQLCMFLSPGKSILNFCTAIELTEELCPLARNTSSASSTKQANPVFQWLCFPF